ncbi:RING/U-box superfamily protein [Perilla frutescens var. hirtella]|uniref:RING-type E3 ubiquitin transferase n=1 Tax=Perilla frutescens var. hirtella TaxID=608512 RepID=A0AAD4PAB6_PERFH|nr:RING/U-box superfamily protein [Perilla frutescens var. hirtella]KAH6816801.1 RING/U-box superfamily protein [Perilla frutescens var. frutescens]KAH6831805.1 RING/U-box superfamily protein [Perilla frutescens var. hirtella]
MKEELLQVKACKHMFHVDCIRHWLRNHSTCPLCRAPVLVSSNHRHPPPMHHRAPPYAAATNN